MSIGILGAGSIGSAFATRLAQSGVPAMIANSRGPDSLAPLVAEIGPMLRAVTREEAAGADMVLVGIPWQHLRSALAGLPDWSGRIVIDANNAVEAGMRPAELGGRASSEVFADLVPGARVVKAFNHLFAETLAADPGKEGGRRVLFYSGDDDAAKAEVGALIDRLGFFGIDLGSLSAGGRLAQFPGGTLAAQNLVRFG